jgi:EmrB/QacA subfamily drug resistance transporter
MAERSTPSASVVGTKSMPLEPSTPPATIGTTGVWEIPTLTRGRTALILAGIMAGLLMGALDNLVVSTVLPQIVKDLNATANGQAFVVSAYLITSTVGTPVFGKLSDAHSRRNFFLLGLLVFIIGSALSGLSQNLAELIAFRAVQGFGSGAFFPVGLSIIAVLFRPEMRARLTGVFSSVFGIAIVAGPALGTFIVDHTTWRWIFYVNLPIGVLGIALLLGALGPLYPKATSRFDAAGAALLSGWVGTLMFALIENAYNGVAWTDPLILGLLAATFILFGGFLVWETRTEYPLVPLVLFKKRVIAAGSAVSFFRGAFLFAVSTFVSIYVGFVLWGNSDIVRDVLYFFIVPMVIGSVFGGQLLTRVSYRVLVTTGMSLMTIGAFLLLFIKASTRTWVISYGFLPTGGIGLDLIPLGFGVGLTFASTALAAQYAVAPKDVGAATSLIQFMASLGGAVVVSVLTSFQASRLAALSASPSYLVYGACRFLGPTSAGCAPAVTSWVATFTVAFPLAIAALVASFFMTGRLPRSRAPGAPAADTTTA